MNWARNVFVRNARLYEEVLEGMWQRGEEDALAISGLLQERGMSSCNILDVPCGIGRVAIPLAQLGFRVHGLDYSPHLVEVAKAKARDYGVGRTATFTQGEMSRLASESRRRTFDCAINVFTSIGYGDEHDDVRFFEGVRRSVRKSGLFLISGLRNRDYIVRNPSQNVYEESERVLVLDHYEFDAMSSRERGSWRFYLKVGTAMKRAGEFPVDIRLYSPHELGKMLEASGWKVTEVLESFGSGRSFNVASPVYSVVAEAV
ncbi:MAG: class I SAM-dependent methyltransferase [Thaumarchaeota archaeon]|nr:class I SAM-dependent methyltransferase [Nitrososphaerota archaeon]